MGLLDDAIREHLELKRRRGADPGEVAREQREALDSAQAAKAASAGGDTAFAQVTNASDPTDVDADALAERRPGDDQPPEQAAHSPLADETAELDMSSVLGDDTLNKTSNAHIERASEQQAHVDASPATTPDDEDSLEWEVPGDADSEPSADAEDVLEETPDFLRDTPEQDRLWFEQRPPRDFDFDK